jgi:hypothetical protein
MNDLQKLLTKEGREFFPVFQKRLFNLFCSIFHRCGWGYSDDLEQSIFEIFEFFGLTITTTGDYKTGYQIEVMDGDNRLMSKFVTH